MESPIRPAGTPAGKPSIPPGCAETSAQLSHIVQAFVHMPAFEHQGVRYQIVRGSDVDRDGMYLELNDMTTGTEELLVEAFYSDAGTDFSIHFFRDSLPFEPVERFVQEVRRLLPPVTHTTTDEKD